jgi:signal transduction histidine kinase
VKSCLVKINVPDKVIIDFDFRFDYEVYCDPYMLERVFNNLLLNAIQAMPEGGVITIQASKRDGKDMISVTDSGAGISEQIKEDLFKPLKTTKPKGVGMGLAVCKKLVNLHQGSISVENVADGACFTIEMPEA